MKSRLAEDPQWGYFALNGKWICPFCLNPVARRSGKTREDSICVHLESCRSYQNGRGLPQPADIIARRQQFENLVHLADTDAAWRVYDPTGSWFCPACLERVPTVRIQGQQLTSFVYQAMAEHLGRCGAYLRGVRPQPEEVQRARDRAARLPALWQFVGQQLQFPAWRYLDPSGLWVCPMCLVHVPQVRVTGEADWQRAPEGMVQHLISHCTAYAQDPNQVQSEAVVRQAAAEIVPVRADNRSPLPISRVLTPLPGGVVPVARPAGSSGGFPTTLPPQGQPAAPQVARPATPLGGSRGVPTRFPTPAPPAPPAQPTGGFRRITDTSPTGSPRIVRPVAPNTPPGAQTPVRTPQVATPLVPPPVTKPNKPGKSAATGDDTLFGKLKEDFLNDTPLGALTEAESGNPPADEAPAPAEAARDEHSGLNWMDDAELGGEDTKLPAAERTDMIKARAVQAGMMQKPPEIPGFRFSSCYEACSDISGDFYQFIRLSDGRLGFALGDVSGHGVQAGLIMSMAKKTLEIYASTGLGPADTLSKVNDALHRDLGGKLFISMVYGLLDPSEHTITWARAGHTPSLRLNINHDEVEEIKPPGMVVGMKNGPLFRKSLQEQTTQLRSGDVFLLYTDGITECMNLQQEEFGPERLVDVVKKFKTAGPEMLIDRIMEIIRHFRGPQPPNDDSTIVAMVVD